MMINSGKFEILWSNFTTHSDLVEFRGSIPETFADQVFEWPVFEIHFINQGDKRVREQNNDFNILLEAFKK